MVRIAYVAQHRRGLRELLEQLAETGYMVYRIDPTVLAYKKLRDNPPDIIIADATLREAHVKEVIESVSSSRITGEIPLCVVGCRAEILDRMRKAAPGANNCTHDARCGGPRRWHGWRAGAPLRAPLCNALGRGRADAEMLVGGAGCRAGDWLQMGRGERAAVGVSVL